MTSQAIIKSANSKDPAQVSAVAAKALTLLRSALLIEPFNVEHYIHIADLQGDGDPGNH